VSRYLYIFGFETPEQARLNRANGWDDEDSRAIFIEAASVEEALSWGRAISEEFLKELHRDRSVSWAMHDYAHWIEDDPAARFGPGALAGLPVVTVCQYPDSSSLGVQRG
jgi:hypothetical protein